MRSICLTLVLFLVAWFSSAQDQRIADSLIRVLDRATLTDSVRLVLLEKIAFNLNDPSRSLDYAHLLVEMAEERQHTGYLFSGYYLLGQAHSHMAEWEKALNAYNEAVQVAEGSGSGQVFALMAEVYSNNGKHPLAIEYYKQAIAELDQWLQSRGDTVSLAGALTNLGYTYYMIDFLDSAVMHFNRASLLFEAVDYEIGTLYCLGNLGLVYAKMGQHDLAEENMKQAIDKLQGYEDFYAIADFKTELADIYRQRSDFGQAVAYARESYEISRSRGLKVPAKDAALELYEIYMDMEEFERAIEHFRTYYSYRDSITNAENIQRIADLRTAFEVGQKQAEVDLLEAEKKNQQVIAISLASVLILVMVLAVVLYRNNLHKRKVNQVLEHQKEQLENLNHTKDRFFSIISHDLRGPVNAFHGVSRMIKFFVKNKQIDQLDVLAEEIDQSVDRLSSLLDNLLNWAVQQQGHVPYIPEKLDIHEMADDLVQTLHTMAKAKDLQLKSQVPEGIILWGDRNTVNTIIRNLVNNAIKFTPEKGGVTIGAEEEGGFAVVTVSDTGVGIPEEKLQELFRLQAKKATWGTKGEKGLGLGLQLVNEFVELNHGKISVSSKEGEGTAFKVWLPIYTEQMAPQPVAT